MSFFAKMLKKVQSLLELQLFGVCNWLGEMLGIASSGVRMAFIYLSFFTFGSPIVIYVIMLFFFNLNRYYRRKRSTIWDF
jgi:phage shock protein PspC (stress-responsive transcriptional regulator)